MGRSRRNVKKQPQNGTNVEHNEQFRMDGYSNMLNKYGTKRDNSAAYEYHAEPFVDDMQLVNLYEGNGLFTKIIDRPAEEAVKHGLDIDYGDEDIAEYVETKMDKLNFEEHFATAEKWSRLYGGAIIVMLVDDGRGLEEPLDWRNARSIEELRVFERAVVQPEDAALYQFGFFDSADTERKFAEPEYYHVSSIYGCFIVHRSRCLIFRNGKLPEHTSNVNYRYWGIPEYVKIKRALRECITSHEDGVKLLERSAQAIYKMKNLANMLSTLEGEDKVLQRLQIIDMARNLMNTIAIDDDGEDYDFKTLTLSGVKDVIDSTCNMLSAVTDIPQTILFGRSPAGMNSTGESDMENYYNMVENIQKRNMKANARTVIDLILRQGFVDGSVREIPKYKVKFAALWSTSEKEQAEVDKTKADTEHIKAQTAQIYMDSNVVDPSEVRKDLASEGEFQIEELAAEDDLNISGETFELGHIPDIGLLMESVNKASKEGQQGTLFPTQMSGTSEKMDGEDYPAASVLVIHDGKILCADRRNQEGICGPGGHVEEGEEPEEAAAREAMEEFHIVPLKLIPLGVLEGSPGQYLKTMVYFTDRFTGRPEADGEEMYNARWCSMHELQDKALFPAFRKSLEMLVQKLTSG